MKTIFDKDFYPTPIEVIELMLSTENIAGKVILEPSAGTGNIVQYLKNNGASEVLACEKDEDFALILKHKCKIIERDFLTLQAHQISHINAIVMNPPFSADEKHILHAWDIAPAGCRIISLCNSNTINNRNYSFRKELGSVVDQHGNVRELGNCFQNAERKSDVQVSMITLTKPGGGYDAEFDGFFLEDDPAELQANAIIPYNHIRDIVNRYIGAVKIYDEQIVAGMKLNSLLKGFYGEGIAFQCTEDGAPKLRNDFKKDLQKCAWSYVFNKMDMARNTTAGLRSDINKFVEENQKIPFTMRNIYRMLEIVIGTTEQRMDKALLEVFDRVTRHYDENRFNVEGWKTNSHYLLNRKFILPWIVEANYKGRVRSTYRGGETVNDLAKALCFLTGDNYANIGDFDYMLSGNDYRFGELYEWGFFQFRAYKKGTVHFTFKSEDVWAKFNQRIAKLNGFPLPESLRKKAQPKESAKQETFHEPEIEDEPIEIDDLIEAGSISFSPDQLSFEL